MLANLLANARTHTRPGTLVSCRLRATASNVVLTVTDNGAGIPDHLQPEIFHRFVRGDSSRSRAAGSTGLGLAIVAAVVAAHHGTVSVQSRPGLTSFTSSCPGRRTHYPAGDLTPDQARGASDPAGRGVAGASRVKVVGFALVSCNRPPSDSAIRRARSDCLPGCFGRHGAIPCRSVSAPTSAHR